MMPSTVGLSLSKRKGRQSQDVIEPVHFARRPKEDTEIKDHFVEDREENQAVDHLDDVEMEL